jgi:hypothetical protein
MHPDFHVKILGNTGNQVNMERKKGRVQGLLRPISLVKIAQETICSFHPSVPSLGKLPSLLPLQA